MKSLTKFNILFWCLSAKPNKIFNFFCYIFVLLSLIISEFQTFNFLLIIFKYIIIMLFIFWNTPRVFKTKIKKHD